MTTNYKSVIERILLDDQTIFNESELLNNVIMSSEKELFLLFSACYDGGNRKAVGWILDNIRDPSVYYDPESFIFTHPMLSEELLTFVVRSVPERFSLANCIDCLITLDSDDKTYAACVKAVKVLGDVEFLAWVNFAMTAEDFDNETVWEFCQKQAMRTAPMRKKPGYIILMPDITKIESNGRTGVMTNPPDDTSQEVLDKMVEELENNVERFRFLGPSNIMAGASSRDVLRGEAEMRMFDDNRMIEEEYDSWFTGNCDECWYKIKKLRYAVRKPMQEGGWVGQFCSWDCVRKNCDDVEGEEIQREMTHYYEKQMNENKIYDNVTAQEKYHRSKK